MITTKASLCASTSSGNSISTLSTEFNATNEQVKCISVYVDDERHTFDATLLSNNDSTLQGQVYASYSASVDAMHLAGSIITAIGFGSLTEDKCKAEIEPYLKKSGESIEITFKIFLSMSASNCAIVGENDNALVKALLGMEDLDKELYAIWGECSLSNDYGITDSTDINNKVAVTQDVTDGITLSADIDKNAKDVIFYYDGSPAIRVEVMPAMEKFYPFMANVGANKVVEVGDCYLSKVVSAVNNSDTPIYNTSLVPVPKSFIKYGEPIINMFDHTAEFMCSQDNEFLLVRTGETIYVIKEIGGILKVYCSGQVEGSVLYACGGNKICLSDAKSYYFYEYDDKGIYLTDTKTYGGNDNTPGILVYSHGILIGVKLLVSSVAYVGAYENGVDTFMTSISLDSGSLIYKGRNRVCMFAYGGYRTVDADGVSYALSDHVVSFGTNNPDYKEQEGEEDIVLYKNTLDDSKHIILCTITGNTLDIDNLSYITYGGDYFILTFTDMSQKLYYHDRKKGEFVDMSQEIDNVNDIRGVGRINNQLVAIDKDGVISSYLINTSSTIIFADSFREGTVELVVSGVMDLENAKPKKATISIK